MHLYVLIRVQFWNGIEHKWTKKIIIFYFEWKSKYEEKKQSENEKRWEV